MLCRGHLPDRQRKVSHLRIVLNIHACEVTDNTRARWCRVVQTVARAAGSKCYVAAAKERLLRLCQLWDDDLFTTTNEEGVRVFVRSLMDTFPNGTPANQAGSGETEDSKFARVCIFRPTGWTLKKDSTTQYKPWIEGRKRQYAVPYSEHSSFDELVAFVRAMKPRYAHR